MICTQCGKDKIEKEMFSRRKRQKLGRMTITLDELEYSGLCRICHNLKVGKQRRKRDNEIGTLRQRKLEIREDTKKIVSKVFTDAAEVRAKEPRS